MRKQSFKRLPTGPRLDTHWVVASALALVFSLSACGKSDADKTAGQQLDAAIAKTGQAAAEAKAESESTLANAQAALKDITQNAEHSAKEISSQGAGALDDLAVTAAVSAGLASDPDLRALNIKVDAKNGAVTLNGSAPTEAARENASTISKAVRGVNSVDNKLIVVGR
ncbi:MAG: BON domain-containing protein [Polaromonas sp.]|uniref:BON domain-containing protein n=1 Tax=Polaromonas sp. TaxID=1869339 RepID=UPI00179EB376|nr:BON domain-containing protein [Polaromonas sp.]NMM10698.1 BON domain-containing protein [Polaromonas sp.]